MNHLQPTENASSQPNLPQHDSSSETTTTPSTTKLPTIVTKPLPKALQPKAQTKSVYQPIFKSSLGFNAASALGQQRPSLTERRSSVSYPTRKFEGAYERRLSTFPDAHAQRGFSTLPRDAVVDFSSFGAKERWREKRVDEESVFPILREAMDKRTPLLDDDSTNWTIYRNAGRLTPSTSTSFQFSNSKNLSKSSGCLNDLTPLTISSTKPNEQNSDAKNAGAHSKRLLDQLVCDNRFETNYNYNHQNEKNDHKDAYTKSFKDINTNTKILQPVTNAKNTELESVKKHQISEAGINFLEPKIRSKNPSINLYSKENIQECLSNNNKTLPKSLLTPEKNKEESYYTNECHLSHSDNYNKDNLTGTQSKNNNATDLHITYKSSQAYCKKNETISKKETEHASESNSNNNVPLHINLNPLVTIPTLEVEAEDCKRRISSNEDWYSPLPSTLRKTLISPKISNTHKTQLFSFDDSVITPPAAIPSFEKTENQSFQHDKNETPKLFEDNLPKYPVISDSQHINLLPSTPPLLPLIPPPDIEDATSIKGDVLNIKYSDISNVISTSSADHVPMSNSNMNEIKAHSNNAPFDTSANNSDIRRLNEHGDEITTSADEASPKYLDIPSSQTTNIQADAASSTDDHATKTSSYSHKDIDIPSLQTTYMHADATSSIDDHANKISIENHVVAFVSRTSPTIQPPLQDLLQINPLQFHHEASDSYRSEDSGIDRSSDIFCLYDDDCCDPSVRCIDTHDQHVDRENKVNSGGLEETGILEKLLLESKLGCKEQVESGEWKFIENKNLVELDKDGLGLGFSIEGGVGAIGGDKPIMIRKIFKSNKVLNGKLYEGDEIVSVNEKKLGQQTRSQAWNLLKQLPEGPFLLEIKRG